jgi:hypothetical protein
MEAGTTELSFLRRATQQMSSTPFRFRAETPELLTLFPSRAASLHRSERAKGPTLNRSSAHPIPFRPLAVQVRPWADLCLENR